MHILRVKKKVQRCPFMGTTVVPLRYNFYTFFLRVLKPNINSNDCILLLLYAVLIEVYVLVNSSM